jgi:hypothetical protein
MSPDDSPVTGIIMLVQPDSALNKRFFGFELQNILAAVEAAAAAASAAIKAVSKEEAAAAA